MTDAIPERLGKYRIQGMLGRGGMGVVLLGQDPDLGREVAIKLLNGRRLDSSEARARFQREARALGRLNEPHIVHVYDFSPEGETPYLVMEFLRGRTLRQVLAQDGPQPLERVVDCAWQVLRGLAVAHGAGIVHRDLKPTNLMLVEGGLYKILDFGLADAADEGELTTPGEVVGTFRYLPPERLRGEEAGPPGDLWSLGATLVELATGRAPEVGGGVALRLPGASEPLLAWLMGLLASDPAARFPTAGAALAALADVMPERGLPSAPAVVRAPVLPLSADDPTRTMPTLSGSGTVTVSATSRPAVPVAAVRQGGRRFSIPFVIKLIVAIWAISSAATFVAGWIISNRAMTEQDARLRRELRSIAQGAAMLIDPAVQVRIASEPTRPDPGLAPMREVLDRFRAVHPEVRYIYTMAPLPETATSGVVQFVCDASQELDQNGNGVIDPDEARALPGQRYPTKDSPELLKGFEEATTDDEPTRDQWGLWMSGYAPIRDAQGRSVGLVGCDVSAAHVQALRRDFLVNSAWLLASTLVAFLAAGALVAIRLRRPVAELQRGMLAVAGGDLEVQISVHSRDEFQVLAEAFERMRDELRRAAAVRQAFEGFVTRSLGGSGSVPTVASPGARLYVHLNVLPGQRGPLPERLTAAMPRLFAHASAFGGLPEQVVGGGVVVSFPAQGPADVVQERAVRAALRLLAELEYGGGGLDLAIGVASGPDAASRAEALGRAGAAAHLDLLVGGADFTPIRPGFYADRVTLPVVGEVFAIKGAVSG